MKKTNPLKISEIEKIARNVREKYNVSFDSPFPILDFIEELNEEDLLTVQYLEDDNLIFEADTPAKYNPVDNFIYVKESVLQELEDNEYRSNFTLAHELFHFLQFRVLNFQFEDVDNCPHYMDPEWQANEFAAQLLLPTNYIVGDCNTKNIAERFKISEECVVTRKLYYERRLKRSKEK